nr:hypothetical protein [Tanacetum cinerariifolium]
LKADEGQKGDDQSGDEQVVVPVSKTQKETPNLLQSTSSHSVSSNFSNQFINSPNASLIGTIRENVKAEINSLLDIQIQQDVPNIQQEPFHAVKVYVIPETTQIPPTTPPAPLLLATEIPSTQVSNSEAVKFVVQRFIELEKVVKELKQVDHSTTILASIKSQVPSVVKDYLGSSLPGAFKKVLQSHTEELKKELSEKRNYKDVIKESVQANVINKVKNFLPKSQSHLNNDTHQELYDALTWSMLLDEATTKGRDNPNKVLKKRDRGDDQDEDPSAGPNQVMKKRRTGKDDEPSKKTSTTKESSKVKSPARTSKSGKYVTAKESVEEPVFEIASDNVKKTFDDKKDWFKKSPRPETLDPDWNTVKTIDDTPEQSWFNEMVQAEKPSLTFDELMSTPIDFSEFSMNHLKLNKITREVLVGQVFNLLKGTCKSCVELEYNMEECYRALTDQLDWENPEGNKKRTYSSSITKTPAARAMINRKSKHEVVSTMRILSVVSVKIEKKSGYGYLEEIVVRRADQKLYKFKEGNFPDLHLNDIKDMLLLIAQNKLFNLDGNVIVDFVTSLRMFTRRIIVKNGVKDMKLGVESY